MVHEIVKEYYGKVLKNNSDLKTTACCTPGSLPPHILPLVEKIHPEVKAKYYGCGVVAPALLQGRRLLDLGAGSGHDVYILSQLAGPLGKVIGIDMTEEQLETARSYISWHTKKFGFEEPNVEFKQGYIERLQEIEGLKENSFDVITSNCVVNLAIDKPAVLKGVFHLLKSGGEFYFSDVYSDRRVTEDLRNDPELYGECLGGALYWNDFLRIAKDTGFKDPRLVTSRPLEITNNTLKEKLGSIQFFSATYRLFKIEKLETHCEDYGQAVIYKGGIPEHPHVFELDNHHLIEKGKIFPVCGNTWHMLCETRFASYFEFFGDFKTHYGIYAGCGTNIPFAQDSNQKTATSCC
ncbi:MAG: methyltransferase domain-containing protein [Hyphomicrobium sp.]